MAKKGKFEWPARCPIDRNGWAYLQIKYHFTPRELQVCIGICRGMRYKQLAESLEIEVTTVRVYLSRIYIKVGVHHKIMLLLRFLENIEDQNKSQKTHR